MHACSESRVEDFFITVRTNVMWSKGNVGLPSTNIFDCRATREAQHSWPQHVGVGALVLAGDVDVKLYRVFQKKMAQSLRHHIFATARHRVVRFSIKCREINCLHEKGQRMNAAVKYSLFCSRQVNYSKTEIAATSF